MNYEKLTDLKKTINQEKALKLNDFKNKQKEFLFEAEQNSKVYIFISEIFKFWVVLTTVFIVWIIFINFNVFSYAFKETFLSYEYETKDVNFSSVSDFSSYQNNVDYVDQTEAVEKESKKTPNSQEEENNDVSEEKRLTYKKLLDDKISSDFSDFVDDSINEKHLKDYLKTSLSEYDFDFNLLPPDSRIIISSIWVDAPIVDVPYISPERMANADFEEELYEWVVKYPFTPGPYKEWNMMLFWHTSYYWWRNNPFGEIFARMPRLSNWDKIQIIWNGNLYEYEVSKSVVKRPSQVSDKYRKYTSWWKYLTLMWCYPIGSDAQRILVIAEQVNIEDVDDDEFSELTYAN